MTGLRIRKAYLRGLAVRQDAVSRLYRGRDGNEREKEMEIETERIGREA